MADDNFFEEDEPVEKIRAAWKHGRKGRTGKGFGMRWLDQLATSWLVYRRRSLVTGTTFSGGITITDAENTVIRNNRFIPSTPSPIRNGG